MMQPSHICHVNYTLNWMHLDYPQFVFSLSEGLDNLQFTVSVSRSDQSLSLNVTPVTIRCQFYSTRTSLCWRL